MKLDRAHCHAELDERTQRLLELVGVTLTPQQAEILACEAQTILVTGGVQAGKSMVASKKLLKEFFDDVSRARSESYRFPIVYWLVAADYERTREEFNYIASDFAQLGLLHRMSKRVDPGFIEISSGEPTKPVLAIIRTRSAKDPTTLAMEAPMGIIACEASQLDYLSYLKLLERIAPHKAWLFLSGTMEGSIGWYPQLRTKWAIESGSGFGAKRSFSLPAHSNLYLYPGGKDDPAILQLKADSPDDFFMERMEGLPCPPRGIVMGEFDPELHVRSDLVYQVGEPVSVWYDPGFDHAAALEAAQIIGGQVRVFDEIYRRGALVEEVIEEAQARSWWGDVSHGVVDIAARAHAGQQQPVAQIWQERTGLAMSAQKVPVNEGTDRFKSFLKVDPVTKQPRMVFAPSCVGVLSELGACASPIDGQVHVYRWRTDQAGNVVGTQPEDRYNDGIKAIIYGLVDRFGYLAAGRVEQKVRIKFFGRPDDRRSRRLAGVRT